MTIITITSQDQFDTIINDKYIDLIMLFFTSPMTEQCQQMKEILCELDCDQVMYNRAILEIPSEQITGLSEAYQVRMVPTIIFIKCGIMFDRVEGFDTHELLLKLSELVSPQDIGLRLDHIIEKLLNQTEIVFVLESNKCRDIIDSAVMRLGLGHLVSYVELSPVQLALLQNGRYLAEGCPQVFRQGARRAVLTSTEGDTSGDIFSQLQGVLAVGIDDRLRKLIGKSRVVLFMKGSPDQPRCGFSRRMVELLQSKKVDYSHFDILTDEEVRSELKRYSNWQTYPQLYVDSQLVGGLDVVKELIDNDELLID